MCYLVRRHLYREAIEEVVKTVELFVSPSLQSGRQELILLGNNEFRIGLHRGAVK